MSGFAGMISLDGATPDRVTLEKMAARLAFRGQDGTHIATQPGAGFCFTFLRTGPAPQCPSQPCTLDGRVWLLGDVRLDGRDDVRLKLEQHGEELSAGATDEELILRTWRLWGDQGIAELIGDYAFALWDAEARQLRCWRDLMGARPFFYAQAGGWFYFSNTLDAIRCAPGISRELDHHFIGDFLLQGSSAHLGRTAFRDIARLPAGHGSKFSSSALNMSRFVSIPVEEPLWLKRSEEYVEQFRFLLEQAIGERLPAAPVAIFMSGGLDSTSIAALAKEHANKRGLYLSLCAYTMDYQPLLEDEEGSLASLAAEHIGIPIKIKSGNCAIPFEGWGDHILRLPEPCNEPFRALYISQHEDVSKYARVAFNGYGGDGILTGQIWPYLASLPHHRKFAKTASEVVRYVLENNRFPPLRGHFRTRLQNLFGRSFRADYPQWINQNFATNLRLPERWIELNTRGKHQHAWYPDACNDIENGYISGVLEGEDPIWTGVATECRAPLFDFRILRFLLRVPPIPLCIDKQLLRQATGALLPEEIRNRYKQPFAGDPLRAQQLSGRWKPNVTSNSPESMSGFVDWRLFTNKLLDSPICSQSPELRPLSLFHWLQENGTN